METKQRTTYFERCYSCHAITATRHVGDTHVLVTHLNVGVKCPGSGRLVTTDEDVLAMSRHPAGCLCARCDDEAAEFAS
jgi:hypothetical protein